MRSRFLSIDYFSSSSPASETPTFLNLPVSDLILSSRRFSYKEDALLRLNSIENLCQIERLPIEDALPKFLSDVIPDRLEVGFKDLEIGSSSNGDCCFVETRRFGFGESSFPEKRVYEEKEVETQGDFESEAMEKDNRAAVGNRDNQRHGFIQFETAEFDFVMRNVPFCEEEIQILSEVPEIGNEMVDVIKPEFVLQNPGEVQQAIYLVDYVSSNYFTKQNTSFSEEDDHHMSLQDNRFPLLEVDEISMSILTSLSLENQLLPFLDKIESQKWNEEDNLLSNAKELLGSVDYNLFEFLSDGCHSKKHLDSGIGSLCAFAEMDILSMLEKSNAKGSFECHQGNFSMMPTFEDYQVLDVGISEIFEGFLCNLKAIETEMHNSIFSEKMNFKNFTELVVSPELALADDTFISLPTPVLCDRERIRSLNSILEEVLLELKPQPLSASDVIYLDWHILEEDKLNHKIPSSYDCTFNEIDSYNIDFDWESLGEPNLVFDFIFSDDAFSVLYMERYKESPNDIIMLDDNLLGVTTGELADSTCKKPGNGELPVETNAEKASLWFKSMSSFDDLAFFLNPTKAVVEENTGPELEASHANAANPVLPSKGYVKVDHSSPDGALYEGVDMPQSIRITTEAKSASNVPDKILKDERLEEPTNFVPQENKFNMRSLGSREEIQDFSVPLGSGPETEAIQQRAISFPNAVIVVNTQNVDKDMIVCRRGTFQKILAMEKDGVQVVERDSDLPVDLMLNSAICLLWYDCENIGKKTAAMNGASSRSPSCIENIATNILTLLSFTFSCCIVIFEGDITFLSMIMESSDELYAASASLGIDLQLFCSFSADFTDEIILRCIRYSIELTRGVCTKMPEAETLAESFLTKFPSVNPLTAHAILSSGGTLNEFLKQSCDSKMKKMRKYYVPDESVDLFSALSKYSEQEDSKSVMTDSSSSVSSGPDSNTCHFTVHSAAKRQKHVGVSQKVNISMDELLHFEPLNEFTDATLNASAVFQSYDSWPSNDEEIFDECRKPGSPSNDMFGQRHAMDFAMDRTLPKVTRKRDSQIPEGTRNLNWKEEWKIPLTDRFSGQKQRRKFTMMDNMHWQDVRSAKNLHRDVTGEVINIADSSFSGEEEDLSSPANFTYIPTLDSEVEKEFARKSSIAMRFSFNKPCHPTLPTATEINSSSDIMVSAKDLRQDFYRNYHPSEADGNDDRFPFKCQKSLLEEVLIQKSAESKELPFKEEILHFGGTPLANSVRSSHPQSGSPWTIEFLNKIRERSRLRQQARPGYVSAPNLGPPWNVNKSAKRKSPSLLELFKYQGGSTPVKVPAQKKQKKLGQSSSSSKNEKYQTSLKSLTPIDKRARQTLTFSTDGRGKQTKLVWS